MSKIEWCDITLNPIVGCSKCSPGCDNCYAEKFATRLAKNQATAKKYAGVVDEKGWTGQFSQPSLADFKKLPKSPRRVFIGSMTDIFHDEIVKGGEYHKTWLPMLFDAMFNYPQHTFLLLTKRPENMKAWIDFTLENCVDKPLPNVWLGVTVCNQEEADKKIPILQQIPAAARFISAEPLLSQIDIRKYLQGDNKLTWVIAGGETGPKARPMHEVWVKSLRDQCLDAGIPYFFKSWGEWLPCSQFPDDMEDEKYPVGHIYEDGLFLPPPANNIPWRNINSEDVCKVGKKQSGHLIDGEEYRQFPEVKNA